MGGFGYSVGSLELGPIFRLLSENFFLSHDTEAEMGSELVSMAVGMLDDDEIDLNGSVELGIFILPL